MSRSAIFALRGRPRAAATSASTSAKDLRETRQQRRGHPLLCAVAGRPVAERRSPHPSGRAWASAAISTAGLRKGRAELQAMRTRKLDASGKGSGDFFAAGVAGQERSGQVRQRRRGDQGPRRHGEVHNLDIRFPDPSSVRALRRGTVRCGTLPPPPVTNGKSGSKKGVKGKAAPSAAESGPTASLSCCLGPVRWSCFSPTRCGRSIRVGGLEVGCSSE